MPRVVKRRQPLLRSPGHHRGVLGNAYGHHWDIEVLSAMKKT